MLKNSCNVSSKGKFKEKNTETDVIADFQLFLIVWK